jgi:hypothetical protein
MISPYENITFKSGSQVDLDIPLGAEPVLKTFASLVHDACAATCNQYYTLSNAIVVDKIVFPDWLKLSRFWYPSPLVSHFQKPEVSVIPFGGGNTNTTQWREAYRKVMDYYREAQINFTDELRGHDNFWQLKIERETYFLTFKSPYHIHDAHIPPSIYVYQAPLPPERTNLPKV